MEISFIYPQMDTEYFEGSIDSFNGDIERDNLRSLLPRSVLYICRIALFIIWAVFMNILFVRMTVYVTAKGVGVIEISFVLYVVFLILSLKLLSFLQKLVRPFLLKLLRGREAIESYSFSKYVERNDKEKLAGNRAKYLAKCDVLRSSKITDASVVCDGSVCRLEVKFEYGGRNNIYSFVLDYKDSADVDRIIVDFDRQTVLFPEDDAEEDNENEDAQSNKQP